MEPILTTDPELQDILAELSRCEIFFHSPEFGTPRAEFEKMTTEDFWETGASGRRYCRQYVMDELEKRASVQRANAWPTSDFYCRRLSDDTYLLTYSILQDNQRLTRRAAIWQRTANGWKNIYHQGTVVQDA